MGVLVEGGGDLSGAMIDLGLVDKVCAFIAPKVIGGSGKSPVEGQGRELMSEAIDLRKTSIERIDKDLLFTGYITDTNEFFPAE
jgi:diaminohydroxyphosphoribosylaminopyrimidine deaminase/5-amino-6-(5-phosphoribosylamino)uracil reductase